MIILLAEFYPILTIQRKIADASSVRILLQNFPKREPYFVLWQFTLQSKPASKEEPLPLLLLNELSRMSRKGMRTSNNFLH